MVVALSENPHSANIGHCPSNPCPGVMVCHDLSASISRLADCKMPLHPENATENKYLLKGFLLTFFDLLVAVHGLDSTALHSASSTTSFLVKNWQPKAIYFPLKLTVKDENNANYQHNS